MAFIKKEYSDGFFNVGKDNGFLPKSIPLEKLPKSYSILQDILDKMPVKINNESGYLDQPGAIHSAVKSLPNYFEQVSDETDIMLIQALYRGYCFLASAYTLEPSFQHYRKTGDYGKAQNILPIQIAQPFVEVSNKLDVYPWLDYHYAYSLGNYKKIDKSGDHKWSNLDMCVRFSGQPDEVGFIMLHVDINQHSPSLVGSVINVLHALKDKNSTISKYDIIHKLFKGLNENISLLDNNIKKKKSSSDLSQLAFKIDRIASGLQYCLDFENKDAEKLSENLRDIYRHIRFSMKCVYEEQNFAYVESSKEVSKTLLDSWSKMKH